MLEMKVGQEKNRKGDASHNINRLKSLVMAGLKSAVQLISREKVYLGVHKLPCRKLKNTCDSVQLSLIRRVIQCRQEAIQSREPMPHELMGTRTHAMRHSHAVLVVSAAGSRLSILAKLNSNVGGLGNGVHTEDLLIARSMTTRWRCDRGRMGVCCFSASEAAPAIEIRGTRFAWMMNITLKVGTILLGASKEESREDM